MLSSEEGDSFVASALAASLLPWCFPTADPPSPTKAIWTYYFKRKKKKDQIPPSATLPRNGSEVLSPGVKLSCYGITSEQEGNSRLGLFLQPVGLGSLAGFFFVFFVCVCFDAVFWVFLLLLIKLAFEPFSLQSTFSFSDLITGW